jgi:uncharacterized BrkB/YihY/UPF0761 family membrane protein
MAKETIAGTIISIAIAIVFAVLIFSAIPETKKILDQIVGAIVAGIILVIVIAGLILLARWLMNKEQSYGY